MERVQITFNLSYCWFMLYFHIPMNSTTSTQPLTLIPICHVPLVHINNTRIIYGRHDKYEFPDFVKCKVGSHIVGSLSSAHYLPSKWNTVTSDVIYFGLQYNIIHDVFSVGFLVIYCVAHSVYHNQCTEAPGQNNSLDS